MGETSINLGQFSFQNRLSVMIYDTKRSHCQLSTHPTITPASTIHRDTNGNRLTAATMAATPKVTLQDVINLSLRMKLIHKSSLEELSVDSEVVRERVMSHAHLWGTYVRTYRVYRKYRDRWTNGDVTIGFYR
jgi:hypothetical protein